MTVGQTIAAPRALVLLVALTLVAAGGAGLAPPRAGAYHFPKCSRVLSRYHHPSTPGPKNVIEVLARRGLSCAHAIRVSDRRARIIASWSVAGGTLAAVWALAAGVS